MTAEQLELIRIKRWFTENDYKVNKVIVGEWTSTDERYVAYINERAVKRARQDALTAIVNLQAQERIRRIRNGEEV